MEPTDPLGVLPEPEIAQDSTFQPISEAERAEYEAAVDHVMENDLDGDGDVDLIDAARAKIEDLKESLEKHGAERLAKLLDRFDGDRSHDTEHP